MSGPTTLDLVVRDKQLVADGVMLVTLVHPEGSAVPYWQPGAHIDLHLGTGRVRQYSLCGDPSDRSSWQIAVLRDDHGRGGSVTVHSDAFCVGLPVTTGGPRNNFALVDAERFAFIVGGIGITPILPMIDALERDGKSWTLMYGGQHRGSMAFLDRLSYYGERVQVFPQDEFGLLDVLGFVNRCSDGTQIYCCGPAPLIDATRESVESISTQVDLHVERFTAVALDDSNDKEFSVNLSRSGITVTVRPDQSILDACELAGISTLSSCAEGICGTCETSVLAGTPEHRDEVLTDAEQESGDTMMICVSRAKTPSITLDL